MGVNLSKDNIYYSKKNNTYNICQVCFESKASRLYTQCGHLGLCEKCYLIILENTTCSINCPRCISKKN